MERKVTRRSSRLITSYSLVELNSLLGGKESSLYQKQTIILFHWKYRKRQIVSGRKGNKTKIFSETKWREKTFLLITIKNQLSIWEYCTTLKCRFNTRHPSFRSCSFLFEPDNHGKKFIMLIGNLLPHNIRCTTT